MNLVALLLLTLHLFIVSCVDAGQVILLVSNTTTRSFVDMEADFSALVNTVETGVVYVAEPLDACQNLRNKPEQSPNGTSPFVLIIRGGGCSFEHKVRNAQRSCFKAAIVYDNVDRNFLLAMGGDSDGIQIQAVFVTKAAGETLKEYAGLAETEVMLVLNSEDSVWSMYATIALILSLAMFGVIAACVFVYRHCTTTHSNATSHFQGMGRGMVKVMPIVTFTCAKEDTTTGSALSASKTTMLGTSSGYYLAATFHAACVDSWLISWRTFCPMCKRDARRSRDEPPATESTPLLSSSIATSSVVCIDPPPLGSPVSFSPAHVTSSYIQQFVRFSSHHSRSPPRYVRRISENPRRQASPLQSSSQRSHISFHSLGYSNMSALDMSPYRPYPSDASPGLVSSTNHLLGNYTANTSPPFASAHSLPDC